MRWDDVFHQVLQLVWPSRHLMMDIRPMKQEAPHAWALKEIGISSANRHSECRRPTLRRARYADWNLRGTALSDSATLLGSRFRNQRSQGAAADA